MGKIEQLLKRFALHGCRRGGDVLVIGNMLGHYRVIERIGSGGMGVVYKAEDIKLGRLVCLKLLSEDISDS